MGTPVHVAVPDGFRDQVASIARRLAALTPDYQNPERFYRRRDDLVDELERLRRRR